MTQVICMWSGPRNLSTAMMRSFGARADMAVFDEPFFAPYLAATGKAHPGRSETLARHETDPDKAAALCKAAPKNGEAFYFQKHMPQHMLPGFPVDWAKSAKHFFLIREPARVIASYIKGRPEFEPDDLGFGPQLTLYKTLTRMAGAPPPVIDSHDILSAPQHMLAALCGALDIPFDPAMLSWEAGPRAEDGAWAPYWYHSVQNSTGFGRAPNAMPVLDAKYDALLTACEADYQELRARKIKAKL